MRMCTFFLNIFFFKYSEQIKRILDVYKPLFKPPNNFYHLFTLFRQILAHIKLLSYILNMISISPFYIINPYLRKGLSNSYWSIIICGHQILKYSYEYILKLFHLRHNLELSGIISELHKYLAHVECFSCFII